ncbi:MAG: phosphate/phosphite/phosphonate ABC transporter substrate-binding protein [Tepidisphaeraceae bacterium]
MGATETSHRHRTSPLVLFLAVVLPVAAIAAVLWMVWIKIPRQQNQAMNEQLVLRTVGLATPVNNRLDARYTDADGDLVADAPADASQQVDPDVLVFSYVAVENPEEYRTAFKEFMDHLAKVTGKRIEYLMATSTEEQLIALRDGKLHVSGINTGSVPMAVNVAGFVPVAKLAGDAGAAYQMELIVPADSPIQKPDQIKGHELALTEAGSNSGFKAPLVLLQSYHALAPGRDFGIRYSNGHNESIKGIADKQYEVAAVANDMLSRAVAAGDIQPNQFRSIFKSESFPTAGFGYTCNLKPELAAKVRQAMETFQWQGTGVEREFASAKYNKLVPVSYKDDWALVRRIDDEIGSVHKLPATRPATQPVAAR